ncbi:hypothetical protein SELMODRAFT_432130 [Selaginella moellendorffii]|uniref:Uncharacterized protein n=1 Tax=Selaginella moellendorffii TaxID=88036 RepID=D8TF26_SELML|nr:hypothetical protein SELMODRAFT_432130 [Selaginella moellendorffii]
MEPDGSRECGNVEPIFSTGEVAGGGGNETPNAIGGGAELGGRNEASGAIGGGADLGGENGKHAVAPECHKNEVVTMLEAYMILNEVFSEMAWKGSQHLQIPLCHLKQSHWVPMDFLVAVWAKKSKVKKLLAIIDIRHDKDWLDCIVEICFCGRNGKALKELIYNIAKSKLSFNEQTSGLELFNTWHRNNDKRLESKLDEGEALYHSEYCNC